MSFGYRYGVPPQADLVFDVRFLPNPYFVPELKAPHRARTRGSPSYVLERPETQEFLDRVVDLAQFLFPRYQREGKAYLTVALGCTGGKHRSVAVAAELAQRLGAGRPASSSGTGTSRRSRAPGRVDRASRRRSRPVTGAEKRCRGSFQPRGLGGRRLAHPRSPSYCEVAREDPVGRTCRMVAAHGGVGVGAPADCREVSSWSGSWSQPTVVWRRSWWRPPSRSWASLPAVATCQHRAGHLAGDDPRADAGGSGGSTITARACIVLADLFGGTPCKESLMLCAEGKRRGARRGEPPDAAQGRLAPEGALPLHELAQSLYTYAQRNIPALPRWSASASGGTSRPDPRPSGLIATVRPLSPEPRDLLRPRRQPPHPRPGGRGVAPALEGRAGGRRGRRGGAQPADARRHGAGGARPSSRCDILPLQETPFPTFASDGVRPWSCSGTSPAPARGATARASAHPREPGQRPLRPGAAAGLAPRCSSTPRSRPSSRLSTSEGVATSRPAAVPTERPVAFTEMVERFGKR